MEAPRVRLSVPAVPEYGRVLRAVADSVAAGADLPSDSIDDLELAIGEAGGALITEASTSTLSLDVDWAEGTVTCLLHYMGDGTPDPVIDELRNTVLRTVTRHYEVDSNGTISLTVGEAG